MDSITHEILIWKHIQDKTRFTKALDILYIKYKDFLNEITFHPDSGKYSFTHKKLVSAYTSIKNNLPYLLNLIEVHYLKF